MNCAACKINKIGPKTAPFGGYLCGNEHMQCDSCNERTDGQCGMCEERTCFVQMNFNQRDRNTSPIRRRTFLESSGATATLTGVDAESRSVAATNSCFTFPKSFYADMETHSSISQEHLSMQESRDDSQSEEQCEIDRCLAQGTKSPAMEYPPSAVQVAMLGAATVNDNTTATASAKAIGTSATTTTAPTAIPMPSPMSLSAPLHVRQYLPTAGMQEPIQMETIFFGSSHQPQSAANFMFQFRNEDGFMRSSLQQEDLSAPTLEVIAAPNSIQLTAEHTNISREDGGCEAGVQGERQENVIQTGGEDTEEIIQTSEIRFMESSESMKNYFSGGTMHPIQRAKQHEAAHVAQHQQHQQHYCQPPEALSAKKLHDFETRNTAHPVELVQTYLRTYGPLALCQFPAYSFGHSCQESTSEAIDALHNRRQSLAHTQPHAAPAANTRTVSASTESEPTLASSAKKSEMPAKYLPHDYFVMQATGVAQPAAPDALPHSAKNAQPSIDLRMQKVLQTFQEDSRTPHISEKPAIIEQAKKYLKMVEHAVEPTAPSPLPAVAPAAPATISATTAANETAMLPPVAERQLDQLSVCELPAEQPSVGIIAQLSNTHRAYYNPPTAAERSATYRGMQHKQSSHNTAACTEPLPQFQLITCSNIMAADLLLAKGRFLNMKPIPACQLTIPRPPIKCPASSCQRMIFVSDFNKHLIVDHNMLPMERIAPRQCKNFFLDPKLAHYGISKCHLLYLIRDKITDLGSSKFKDYLPLLVMSTCIRLSDLCGIDAHDNAEFAASAANREYLVIWLTGIVPEEFPVGVTLTVWPRLASQAPTCHMVHSGEMYSVRRSQDVRDVCGSGQMLLLSAAEIQLLTNGGKEMLELQIVVH